MTLKEIQLEGREQLMIPLIELGQVVRELVEIEAQKTFANENWNYQIKGLKKRMVTLAHATKERE